MVGLDVVGLVVVVGLDDVGLVVGLDVVGLVIVLVVVRFSRPRRAMTSAILPRLKDGATDGAVVLATGEGACPGAAVGVLVMGEPINSWQVLGFGLSLLGLVAATWPASR